MGGLRSGRMASPSSREKTVAGSEVSKSFSSRFSGTSGSEALTTYVSVFLFLVPTFIGHKAYGSFASGRIKKESVSGAGR